MDARTVLIWLLKEPFIYVNSNLAYKTDFGKKNLVIIQARWIWRKSKIWHCVRPNGPKRASSSTPRPHSVPQNPCFATVVYNNYYSQAAQTQGNFQGNLKKVKAFKKLWRAKGILLRQSASVEVYPKTAEQPSILNKFKKEGGTEERERKKKPF